MFIVTTMTAKDCQTSLIHIFNTSVYTLDGTALSVATGKGLATRMFQITFFVHT